MPHHGTWTGRGAQRAWRALPVLTVLALPAASLAVLPLLAVLAQKAIRDMVFNQVKGQLISSMAGMGCKGTRLAGLIATASAQGAGLRAPSLHAPAPSSVAGAAGGSGLAGSAAMGGAAPPGANGGHGVLGRLGGLFGKATRQSERPAALGAPDPGGQPTMAQAMAAIHRQHPGPGGPSLTPEQMEKAQAVMGEMQDAASHPLSRAETLEVFDELVGLGVLTDSMHGEARECILLAAPGADQALGSSGAMLKSVLLPRLREMKARFASLAPEEEDQLADGAVQALREASAADRKDFEQGLGAGLFPPSVVEKVHARLAAATAR